MAISWPFDSTLTQDEYGNPVYSRAYSSDVIARILARYFRNGVFSVPSTGLQTLQHEGMTVLVKSGAANINGRQFDEETDRVLTVQAADASLDRIDTVVLRLSLEQSVLAVDLYIVMGSPAAIPSAPELTRNASTWELGLANLFIAKGVTTITLAGAFSGILVSNRLVQYRLEQLEKQMSAQNAMVERVYGTEKRLDVFDEQIRLACHRLDHLEHYEM